MSPRLEDELSAGLREHAAGLHLSRDVLGAARRRHHRRTVVTRVVSAIGTLGVAGAVTAVVLLQRPLIDAERTQPSAPPPAAVNLDAQIVAARVSQALTDVERMVMHVEMTITYEDRTSIRHGIWIDPVTGDSLTTGRYDRGVEDADMSVIRRPGGKAVETVVNHARRIWWRDEYNMAPGPVRPWDSLLQVTDGASPDFSPQGLRTSMRRGEFTIVGTQRLNGRSTVRLRITDAKAFGSYDLWVDAETYVLVHRQIAGIGDDPIQVREDYEYLPRTPEALAKLRLTPPPGYRQARP